MSRVYVIQEPLHMRHGQVSQRFDLTPAEKFGELEFVLAWNDTRRVDQDIDDITNKVARSLIDFSDDDYILLTGDWCAMALSVAQALRVNGGRAKCLQWDRERRGYMVVQIDTNESEDWV